MAWLAHLPFRGRSPGGAIGPRPTGESAEGFTTARMPPGRAKGLFRTRLRSVLEDLARRGIDLVCPPRCGFCRAETASGGLSVVCPECQRLLASDLARCLRCGAPAAPEGACRSCRGRWREWDGIVLLGSYTDHLRQAVLAAKRPAGELVVAGLAALLWDKHRDTLAAWRPDLVVPVPMHWTRRAARGTSAAQGLARQLGASLGVPCRGPLRRVRATRMQNELPPGERRANVRGVFRSSPAVAGRRVLLVDDVTTTGATLAECRAALVAAGATAVHAAVVARADRGDPGTD
jgi:ComF family protein